MAIQIEFYEASDGCDVLEDCIFCGDETAYWDVEVNRPVCPKCSVENEPEQIPNAKFNY